EIQPLGDDWYWIRCGSGMDYRAHLTLEQFGEYLQLKGIVRTTGTPRTPYPTSDEPIRRPEAPAPLTWRGPGQRLRFGAYVLEDPLTYCSQSRPAEAEASCIDGSLPISVPVAESPGALGYWPEYARMTPGQRATYLRWMAGGRTGSLHDIG